MDYDHESKGYIDYSLDFRIAVDINVEPQFQVPKQGNSPAHKVLMPWSFTT